MVRRLGTLALVLVSNVALVVTPARAGPPEGEPIEAPIEGPIEGPSRPPTEPEPKPELPPPEIELGPHEAIEFAPPLPDPEAVPRPASNEPVSRLDEIGKAPNSGAAFVAGGACLLPLAAFGTVTLVQANRVWEYPPHPSEPGIIVAGVGLGVIGASMLGIGIHRLVALSRWAKRHRVIALAQGSGLLTSGTLFALVGVGVLIPAIQNRDPISGAIAGAMLVSAPIQIVVGSRFARRYARTGGWRPTRYTLSPGGLRLQF